MLHCTNPRKKGIGRSRNSRRNPNKAFKFMIDGLFAGLRPKVNYRQPTPKNPVFCTGFVQCI